MHVRVRFSGFADTILLVESKLTRIEDFKNLVREKFRVEPGSQLLFYGGKLLEDGYTFHDYNIKLNDVIQLMEKQKPTSVKNEATKSPEENKRTQVIEIVHHYKETESKLYKVGDFVDMKNRVLGTWEESVIVKIVIDQNIKCNDNDNASEPNKETDNANILYKVKYVSEETNKYYCKASEIRPRARNIINAEDVKVGQIVMLNHNFDEPNELGDWYDFLVEDIKKVRKQYTFIGELFIGAGSASIKTTVKVMDKIFAIEKPVPLSQRDIKYSNLIATPPPQRQCGVICRKCRDDPDKLCSNCGCFICEGKDSPDKILICDECNNGFHLKCLIPPVAAVPEDDWYCDSCKRDPNEVIAPGGSKQTKKTAVTKNTRDWGRGMACVGKTKHSEMPVNHFGPIPGMKVGMSWKYRMQLSETGLHRPSISGIHGRDSIGAFSIVLSGGYEDDEDHGTEFTYTGSGGRDLSGNKRTAKQSKDQKFVRENRALARNCAAPKVSERGGDAGEKWREGKPVRVMRSCKMLKAFPKYAPKKGIRYDGIYKVVKYYPETGKSGFSVYKYLLRRDDPSPAPWEPNAEKYDIVYPDGYLEAEAQKSALKKKKKSGSTDNNSSESFPIEKKNKGDASGSGNKRPLEVDHNGKKAKRRKIALSDTSDESLSENNMTLESDSTSSGESPPKNTTRTPDNSKGMAGSNKTMAQGIQKLINTQSKSKKSKKSNQSKSKKLKKTKESKVKLNDSMQSETSGSGTSTSPADAKSDKRSRKRSASLMKVIESDELNSKLWKEPLSQQSNGMEFIESVSETFRCIVCQCVVVSPVTTPCQHNFCFTCLERAFKAINPKICPHCRHSLNEFEMQVNEKLQHALRIILPGYDAK